MWQMEQSILQMLSQPMAVLSRLAVTLDSKQVVDLVQNALRVATGVQQFHVYLKVCLVCSYSFYTLFPIVKGTIMDMPYFWPIHAGITMKR